MGFFDQASTAKESTITILLPGFEVACTLRCVGVMQTFLNDEQRGIFALSAATVYGLEEGNPATSMKIPDLFVRKRDCHAIIFPMALPRDESGLLPRTERLAVYTSHYAIQGDFHMGADANVGDFIDSSKLLFVGASNVTIHPLFAPQSSLTQQGAMVFIARDSVRMHHRI